MKALALRNTRVGLAILVTIALAAALLVAGNGEADAGARPLQVIGVEVDIEINDGTAAQGNTGWALMSVLVTKSRNQRPVSNVANSVSRDDNGITLPARVELAALTVPPGGCAVTPTQFSNSGNGVYSIRFVPAVSNPSCDWLSGDYIYAVTIKGTGGAILGKGLAKFTL